MSSSASLAWATTSAVGESEIALRLWSVVPFLAGRRLVTAWLHARLGALTGILFLFFATASPLLLDILDRREGTVSAYLAMGVMLVAALEARRTGRRLGHRDARRRNRRHVHAPSVRHRVRRDRTGHSRYHGPLRRWTIIGLRLSRGDRGLVRAAHRSGARRSSDRGRRADRLSGVVTAPFHHVLIPALLWIDGTVLVASVVWIPLVLLAVVVLASSPLAHERGVPRCPLLGRRRDARRAVARRAYVIPRYLSFLLVPLFILLASGAARS